MLFSTYSQRQLLLPLFLNQTKPVEVAVEGHFHVNASRIFEEYRAWLPKTARGFE